MGSTSNYFERKKKWSKIKDSILDYYLKPYLYKISTTHKPLTIIDCFAGKGKFDDGGDGSPIIISKRIKEIYNHSKIDIEGIFIEKKYHEDLKENLRDYEVTEVWAGYFEENFPRLLRLGSERNIFFYIDPYGPKSLSFNRFNKIVSMNFSSVEMLINFNSIGFFREGYRLLSQRNLSYKPLNHIDLFEDDNDGLEYEYDSANNIQNMNRIADGDYWQSILESRKNNEISKKNAEDLFIKEYVGRLENIFEYVINIPIRLKSANVPKYRMIYCTNNQDGLFLMVNNMNNKWGEILKDYGGEQLTFLEFDFQVISNYDYQSLEEKILKELRKQKKTILLNDLLVTLIKKYGILYSIKQYEGKLRDLEKRKIKVIRDPEYTEKTHKPATALHHGNKKYKIYLRLKNGI